MAQSVDGLRDAQRRWATTASVPMLGEFAGTARPCYTRDYRDNLFEPLSVTTERQFTQAHGNELSHGRTRPAKMAALHSSSALACNFFHYWSTRDLLAPVLQACELPADDVARFTLETKLPIDERFDRAPNLDACVTYGPGSTLALAGIECKFCEPYSRTRKPLSARYLDPELARLWEARPALRSLAVACTAQHSGYRHLDVPQLLKHLLGLRNHGAGRPTHLLYLYFDGTGPTAERHRDEIERFAAVAAADDVRFSALSYQTAMTRLAAHRGRHAGWFEYMSNRYFADGVHR